MSARAWKRGAALAAATLVVLPVAAAAAAAGDARPETALQAAVEALSAQGSGGAPDREPTAALTDLAAAYPGLEGEERRAARGLLARPTDGPADQFGDGYPPGAPVASAQSTHFCVFWVNDGGFNDAPSLDDTNGVDDGDGVPDYVEKTLEFAEASYLAQVAPAALGWVAPKPDDGRGCGPDPSAHSDIYLKQIGNQGLFGYMAPDPVQAGRSLYGYLVLDDDYAPSEFGPFPDPLDPARVTIAHEFSHLLQIRYDARQELWMLESTAVWAEEQVFPAVNDYLRYVGGFAATPGTPITDPGGAGGLRVYGAGVWNHWLDVGRSAYGAGVIRRSWEVSPMISAPGFAIGAYDAAIRGLGGRNFSREFARFGAATAEWRTGSAGFPDAAAYPDVRRRGSLRRGGPAKSFDLDHTASRLVRVEAGGRNPIILRVHAEPGVRTGISLVARDGGALTGTVRQRRLYLGDGGRGSVRLDAPGRFERITAVVVNADGRATPLGSFGFDYRKDNSDYRVRISG